MSRGEAAWANGGRQMRAWIALSRGVVAPRLANPSVAEDWRAERPEGMRGGPSEPTPRSALDVARRPRPLPLQPALQPALQQPGQQSHKHRPPARLPARRRIAPAPPCRSKSPSPSRRAFSTETPQQASSHSVSSVSATALQRRRPLLPASLPAPARRARACSLCLRACRPPPVSTLRTPLRVCVHTAHPPAQHHGPRRVGYTAALPRCHCAPLECSHAPIAWPPALYHSALAPSLSAGSRAGHGAATTGPVCLSPASCHCATAAPVRAASARVVAFSKHAAGTPPPPCAIHALAAPLPRTLCDAALTAARRPACVCSSSLQPRLCPACHLCIAEGILWPPQTPEMRLPRPNIALI